MIAEKYSKPASRANPGCFIFLLDHSYSMTDGIAGSQRRKCEALATAINRFLSDLIILCEQGEEKPRHYFDIAVIGYTTDVSRVPVIASGFQGNLVGRDLVSVVELSDNVVAEEVLKRDDGAGGLVEIRIPQYYRPPGAEAMGGTPMVAALEYANRIAADWCASHQDSFPPVVLHLTDGEPTDGTPEAVATAATALTSLGTMHGNLLLFNCHLSSVNATPVAFPGSEAELPDDFSKMLFRISSVVPDTLRAYAEAKQVMVRPSARGMVFNADSTQMLVLISVGTIPGRSIQGN